LAPASLRQEVPKLIASHPLQRSDLRIGESCPPETRAERPMKFLVAVVLATMLSVSVWSSHAQELFGRFKGEIVVSWDAGGRNMKLQSPFGYVDPSGLEWDVPAGYETDGASVPAIFWSLYPPFTGKYRAAAVIHDYYCYTRSRPWLKTHQVFYFAMRAAGVAARQAQGMYGAI